MIIPTQEEFNVLVDKILYGDEFPYTELIAFIDSVVRPAAEAWCNKYGNRGKFTPDEILQDVYLRVSKKCITHFFLRNGANEAPNRDPLQFAKWVAKIYINIRHDTVKRYLNYIQRYCPVDEEREDYYFFETSNISDVEEVCSNRQEVSMLFDIVMDMDTAVHKKLTWFGLYLITFTYGITKIEATRLLVSLCGDKTLYQMRQILVGYAQSLVWLDITDDEVRKIDDALDKDYDHARKVGDAQYKEFFMKKGGRASVSDWVNKLNDALRQEIKE